MASRIEHGARAQLLCAMREACDAFRRPDRFRELLLAFEADHRGRGGFRLRPYPQAAILRAAQEKAMATTLSAADREGLSGEEIGAQLRRRRLAALRSPA